jgi:hypothetical protein
MAAETKVVTVAEVPAMVEVIELAKTAEQTC